MSDKTMVPVQVDAEKLKELLASVNEGKRSKRSEAELIDHALDVLKVKLEENRRFHERYQESVLGIKRPIMVSTYYLGTSLVNMCRTPVSKYYEVKATDADIIGKALMGFKAHLERQLKQGRTYRDAKEHYEQGRENAIQKERQS